MTLRPALLLGAVLALSGCSAAASAPAAPASLAAPASPAAPASLSSAPDGCGDVVATVRDHLDSPEVVSVGVNGQCTNVDIATTLADDDVAGGRRLCTSAGEVAYTGDINSVTVKSKAGTELSAGIPGMKCLP